MTPKSSAICGSTPTLAYSVVPMAKPPTIMDSKAGKVPRWVETAIKHSEIEELDQGFRSVEQAAMMK
ncbi:hypothetical protein [Xanthomonas arboricola]|uniref:hypothetical protein n=1 Tax=Xanthomonas arboricola TaxID=56448 RepID=UPI000A59DEE8|nr:hypothetical protein [Xanthomonas arboricola]